MRIECAGAIVRDQQGRLLLIQRGHAPDKGKWSLPGGGIEAGESAEEAAVREVLEETGLDVRIVRLAGVTEWELSEAPHAGDTLHISDFVVECVDPTQQARAGDDAAALRWVTRSELATIDTTRGLIDYLADWGVLPSAT